MEKWLMILNLGKYEKYYMVRKDKLKEVGDVASRLIDEFEHAYPGMSPEKYVENGLEIIYDKADVEPVKIGLKVIRMVE